MGSKITISNTELVKKIFATRLEGTITLSAQTGKLEKFTCANITVIVTSKALLPHYPNEFSAPKWVRTTKAKMIAGKCSYSIVLPPSSQFYVTAAGHGRGFACTSIDVWLTPTGAALGSIAVPLGGTRRLDLVVEKVTCNMLA